jgi:HK97 family phage portal protein
MSIYRDVRDAFAALAALGRRTRARAEASQTREKGADWGWPTMRSVVTPEMWQTGLDTLLPLVRTNLSRPYGQAPTVYRAVKTIATAIAQLQGEVWKANPPGRKSSVEEEAVEGHWLPSLLAAPSPTMVGDQLIEAVVTFLEIRGEAFLLHSQRAQENARAPLKPNEIWLIDPAQMTPKVKVGQAVTVWTWNTPSGPQEVEAEDLTFLRYNNPYDPCRGLAPLQAAEVEITGDWRMANYNNAFFGNFAVPPILFYVEGEQEWLEEDRERFLELWQAKQAGQGAHKAGALPRGVRPFTVDLSQNDMQFLEGRRFTREQILSVFGVPPAIAGVFEYANYANSREQLKFFWHVTLLPKIRYIEAALTRDLLQRYEAGSEFFFKTEPVLAEIASADYKEKVGTGKALWDMGWPAADVNDRLDLGMPTDGRPWLEEGFLPLGLQPAGLALEPAPPEAEIPEEMPQGGGKAARKAAQVKRARHATYENLAAHWTPIARSYSRAVKSWVWELRAEVLRRLEKNSETLPRAVKSETQGLLFDAEEARVKLVKISRAAWTRAAEQGASALGEETGVEVSFDLLDPKAVAFLASKEMRIRRVSDTIRQDVREALSEGIAEGESVKQLAERVREVFDVARGRAMTIARTETAQAFNGGRYLGMKEAGIEYHQWLTSADDRVRDLHEALMGEAVPVGEAFVQNLKYPGDPDGEAEQVINCRCVTIPIRAEELSPAGGGEEES